MSNANQSRQSNFELLRIICIFFIIITHIILFSPTANNFLSCSLDYYISNIVKSFTIPAVNCFILISGYFGIRFNIKKLIKIECSALFYSIGLLAVSAFSGIHVFDIKADIGLFFPIITKQWWFITTYFILVALSPWLNKLIDTLTKHSYQKLLLISFLAFSVLPSLEYILGSLMSLYDFGYGIVNFTFLYLLGRYIRLHGTNKQGKYRYLVAYVCFCLLAFAANELLTRSRNEYFYLFFSYDSVFCILAAIAIFLFFKNIHITSKFINYLSPHCLAVYTIHLHPVFAYYLFETILNVPNLSGTPYTAALIFYPAVIFMAAFVIEKIRLLIFNKAENYIAENISNFLDKKRRTSHERKT